MDGILCLSTESNAHGVSITLYVCVAIAFRDSHHVYPVQHHDSPCRSYDKSTKKRSKYVRIIKENVIAGVQVHLYSSQNERNKRIILRAQAQLNIQVEVHFFHSNVLSKLYHVYCLALIAFTFSSRSDKSSCNILNCTEQSLRA